MSGKFDKINDCLDCMSDNATGFTDGFDSFVKVLSGPDSGFSGADKRYATEKFLESVYLDMFSQFLKCSDFLMYLSNHDFVCKDEIKSIMRKLEYDGACLDG